MADETHVEFSVPGSPGAFLAVFKAAPPAFLVDDGYRLVDESYESLVYEANATTTFTKLFTWGFGKTVYRLVFTFRDVGDGTTKVTVIGQAKEDVRGRDRPVRAEASQVDRPQTLRSWTMRRPWSVSQGSKCSIVRECGMISSARPPVATTVDGPSSARKRSTIASI